MDLQGVKARITQLRGSLSKKQFSENVGINPSYLSQIENQEDNQKPSIEALVAISRYCNVTIDYILKGGDSELIMPRSFLGLNKGMQTAMGNVAIRKPHTTGPQEKKPRNTVIDTTLQNFLTSATEFGKESQKLLDELNK